MTPNPLRPPHPSAGFSLVELMIAVAIVGILTAIALPNLARQTDKAKATEAKILTSAAAKEAQIAWAENGQDGLNTWASAQCPAATRQFSFSCMLATETDARIIATGSSNAGGLRGQTIVARVNPSQGGEIRFCGTAAGIEPC
ncbi:MAG: type II secretion system protein [Synechococcaceae bacterium WB9_2_112]|nr:type II secretion system protein [Synechococcaceae bacterium WB9_2_112]